MRLTTKGRYAVTAMLDLAIYGGDQPTKLADIAERQSISLAYLEQLFSAIRKQGLVFSTRGANGGYSLGLLPQDISVADIVAAVDEPVNATRCGGTESCKNSGRCLTHDLWSDLTQQIHRFLDGVTLQQLMDKRVKSNNGTVPLTPSMAGDVLNSTEKVQ